MLATWVSRPLDGGGPHANPCIQTSPELQTTSVATTPNEWFRPSDRASLPTPVRGSRRREWPEEAKQNLVIVLWWCAWRKTTLNLRRFAQRIHHPFATSLLFSFVLICCSVCLCVFRVFVCFPCVCVLFLIFLCFSWFSFVVFLFLPFS